MSELTPRQKSLATFFRRGKWLIILAWIIIAGVAVPISSKLSKVTTNDPTAFLPQGTQSTEVARLQSLNANSSQTTAVIAYQDLRGITGLQKDAIVSQSEAIRNAHLPGFVAVTPPSFSADSQAAIVTVIFDAPLTDQSFPADTAKKLDPILNNNTDGLSVKLTGELGVAADIGSGGGDAKLLITTVIIITILLLLTYRSPILWVLPLIAAGIATQFAQSIVYVLAEHGLKVDTVVVSILLVLVFGAATDYALLILSRYREELHLHDDKHDAIGVAMGRTAEAITAAAFTVTLALLALLFASDKSSQGLAIVGALGIMSAWLVQMTLLPAVLAIGGRKLLWPRIPKPDGTNFSGSTLWHRVSVVVGKYPGRLASIIIIVLVIGAAGLSTIKFSSNPSAGLRGNPPSVQGQAIITEHFPAGSSDPIVVVINDEVQASQALAIAKEQSAFGSASEPKPLGSYTSFDITLNTQPYGQQSYAFIKDYRNALSAAGLHDAKVGGNQAIQYDSQTTSIRDDTIIIPLILLIVTLILGLLLRAVIAPIILLLTVVLSFAFSFGISLLVFQHLFHFDGINPGVPLFSFLFIVALGVDYNIFLMDRARQETGKRGTTEGILTSLRVTGGVITAAGLVLAGTFAALAQIPFVVLTELGFAIAFGILVDSFLVRSILVPSLVIKTGPKTWWPSRLSRKKS